MGISILNECKSVSVSFILVGGCLLKSQNWDIKKLVLA